MSSTNVTSVTFKPIVRVAFLAIYVLSVSFIIITVYRGLAPIVGHIFLQVALTLFISVGILVSSHLVGQATESSGAIQRSLKTMLALCLFIMLSSPAVFFSFTAFYDLIAIQNDWLVPTEEDRLEFYANLLVDIFQNRGPVAALAVLANSIILVSFPVVLNILKFRVFHGVGTPTTEADAADPKKRYSQISWQKVLVAVLSTVEVILGFLSFTYAVAWYFRPSEDYEPTIVLFTVALVVVEIARKRLT